MIRQFDIMSKLDIRFCRLILVVGGLIIVISELCLLLDQWFTGYQGLFPVWVKILILAGGLLVIVLALAVRVEEGR